MEEDPETVIQTWKGFYVPAEIPEGFQTARAVDGETAKIIEYRDSTGHRILFYQYTPDTSLDLDQERAAALSVQDNGDAYAYEKDGTTTYYWFTEERAYVIEFPTDAVTLDAVERMVDSLRLIT